MTIGCTAIPVNRNFPAGRLPPLGSIIWLLPWRTDESNYRTKRLISPVSLSVKEKPGISFSLILKEFMVSFRVEPRKMKPISSGTQALYRDENPLRCSFPALKVKPLMKSYNGSVKNDYLQCFTEAVRKTLCVFINWKY